MSSNNIMEITLVMNNKGAITGIKDFTGKIIEIPDVAKAMKKSKERFKELSDFTKGTIFEVGQVVQASNELQYIRKV